MKHNFDTPFDTLPSIELDHRPFFSIVIACYNSRKYIGNMLESIVNQHMDDDIEVILADDCSPESYQDIVDKYNRKLCIRQIKTDYNFAPGNTREKGCSIATGEWLCFGDHDDEFVPDTLSKIKKEILEKGEKYHVVANFKEIEPGTFKVRREMVHTRNWCHAKFYNLDNFWRAYNIHFKKDLKTHEDIYVSTRVMCILTTLNGDKPMYSDIFCYYWMGNPESISRTKYNDTNFVENFFDDYLESTGRAALDAYLHGEIPKRYATLRSIDVILFCYFYMQRFKYKRPKDYVKSNMDLIREYYIKCKTLFVFSNLDVYDMAAKNDAYWYVEVRKFATTGVGPFVEQETLLEFLNSLDKDEKEDYRCLTIDIKNS